MDKFLSVMRMVALAFSVRQSLVTYKIVLRIPV